MNWSDFEDYPNTDWPSPTEAEGPENKDSFRIFVV